MKIGILTSSRADFGIYKPLISEFKKQSAFEIEVIAFGTHLSDLHGNTVQEIIDFGMPVIHKITTNLSSDDESSISTSYGLTVLKFAEFWKNNTYDLVFCLGDRYEMNASVQAGIPFRVKFAHLYGGEITLGSIDNIYRDQITAASTLHFTSTEEYASNVSRITGTKKNIFVVGSLSLDKDADGIILPEVDFQKEFLVPFRNFILMTFHPETIDPHKNKYLKDEITNAIAGLIEKYNFVITLPNSDTFGNQFREQSIKIGEIYPEKIKIINNFGKTGYFSALKYCQLVLGNSSSGIVEAASFNKYVVDVGDRQKGRATSKNVIHCRFDSVDIIETVNKVIQMGEYCGGNIYYRKNVAKTILKLISN